MAMAVIGDEVVDQAALEAKVMADVPDPKVKWPGLIGSQTPRLSNYPTFFTSMADDGVDFVETFGYTLLPWQEALFRHSLGETVDGLWSARRVGLIVVRQ